MRNLRPAHDLVIQRMLAIESEKNGKGHGTLRVEITDGKVTLIKREYSEIVRDI